MTLTFRDAQNKFIGFLKGGYIKNSAKPKGLIPFRSKNFHFKII